MSETQPTAPADPVVSVAPGVKRTIPVKEPPPFKWKLMGYVDGYTVTLLKAIEREDAEAQLLRLQEEGYYRGLEIYPIDAKVPADPDAGRIHRERKAKEKTAAREAAAKESARRSAAAKRSSPSKPARKPAAKAAKPRPAAKKSAKKK